MDIKLRPEDKKAWVDALLSDEYLQGSGELAKNLGDGKIGYCCLGVYCVVKGIDTVEIMNKAVADITPWVVEPALLQYGAVPEPFKEGPNQDQFVGAFLASMNDSGSTFSDIAAWISDNL